MEILSLIVYLLNNWLDIIKAFGPYFASIIALMIAVSGYYVHHIFAQKRENEKIVKSTVFETLDYFSNKGLELISYLETADPQQILLEIEKSEGYFPHTPEGMHILNSIQRFIKVVKIWDDLFVITIMKLDAIVHKIIDLEGDYILIFSKYRSAMDSLISDYRKIIREQKLNHDIVENIGQRLKNNIDCFKSYNSFITLYFYDRIFRYFLKRPFKGHVIKDIYLSEGVFRTDIHNLKLDPRISNLD